MEQNEAQMVGSLPEAEVNGSKAKTQGPLDLLMIGVGFLVLLVLAYGILGNYLVVKRHNYQRLVSGCHSNIEKVASALEDYAKDHGGRYPDSLHRLTGGPGQRAYLKSLPTCPAGQRNTFQNYRVSGSSVSFGCCATNHTLDGLPADFLTYRSQQR